jgi:hypothetical protein
MGYFRIFHKKLTDSLNDRDEMPKPIIGIVLLFLASF